MGLFDWFEPHEKCRDTFCCSACSKAVTSLQTKSFDCAMDRIRMKEDGSLEAGVPRADEADEGAAAGVEDLGLHYRYRIVLDTCYARVYSDCRACETWNEWRLHVREGKVVEIVRVERDR